MDFSKIGRLYNIHANTNTKNISVINEKNPFHNKFDISWIQSMSRPL